MAALLGDRLRRILLLGAIAWVALVAGPRGVALVAGPPALGTGSPAAVPSTGNQAARATPDAADETNPLGANAACYICHIPFVKEELSRQHLKAKVGCTECHGLSAQHANDENVGATPPEVVFKREAVDAMCAKCHETHNVAARKVIACLQQRRLSPQTTLVCTDCHGTHKIERAAETGSGEKGTGSVAPLILPQ
jgi:hypothetical protein